MESELAQWKAEMLGGGGKVTLIKSVNRYCRAYPCIRCPATKHLRIYVKRSVGSGGEKTKRKGGTDYMETNLVEGLV